ncbi:MAG: 4'-phosphopantetheinyl transferase superfamily protein [Clostridia bacterium]|nr:4'-phosphopantetheinyl transferase superfamily protein [Clostridia bacterium]
MEKARLVFVDGRGTELKKLMHPLFSDERLLKITRRKAESLRIDSACAELAFLAAQKIAFGGIKKNLYFYGENDKPYFKDEKYGCLSFAHASSVGACLIAPVRCGCDIEDKNRDVGKIEAKIRFFKGGEEENALTLWCAKESYVKLTGEGLSKPFSELFLKNSFLFDRDETELARVKTGEIGRIVWAASFVEEIDMAVTLLTAEKVMSMLSD